MKYSDKEKSNQLEEIFFETLDFLHENKFLM